MTLAAAAPFKDLRPLVFRDHALELHKQLVLCRRCLRRLQEDGVDTMAREFFDQKNLISVFAAQPVGRIHQHRLDLTLRREIAYPLEPGAYQGGTTITLVFEDPLCRDLIASAPRELDQGRRLAGNRALLPLLVRGHPCVDRRDRHCCPPSPWNARRQFGPDREPAVRRLAEVCSRAGGRTRNQAGLGSDPDAAVAQPCPRTAARKAVIARVTISLIVKPLTTE
jgi:hypothetical protein